MKEGQPNITIVNLSKAISRKRCKIQSRVQLMTNSLLYPPMVTLMRFLGPNFGTTFISLRLMELRRSTSTRRQPWTRTQTPRRNFSLEVAQAQCPNSIYSELLEFSVMSRARKFIFGQQVNTYKANSRRYDVNWQMVQGTQCFHHQFQYTVYL